MSRNILGIGKEGQEVLQIPAFMGVVALDAVSVKEKEKSPGL